MKAAIISKENGEAKFSMDFTAEELDSAVVKVYQRTKDSFSVDGFRKGKAPRSIIEKRYGENVFVDDAVNDLFNAEYFKAVQELELAVIDAPRIEFSDIKKGEAFTATVTVATYPEIKVENYKGVEIERVSAEVTDEDIEKELETMQKRSARMITVDREAKDGDTVVIDYKGFVGEEQFEGGTAEAYSLKLGSGSFIPGFEDQLIGTKKDDEKDVVVTFPEEYHSADLAGKEAVFKCKVHEVKEEEMPEIDDEFAKDTSEYDTLDELKESIREDVKKRKESQAENKMKDSVIEKIYEANDVNVPDVMVDDEVDAMVRESEQQLSMSGLQLEQYLKMVGQDMAGFRKDIREEAFRRVKSRMLISAVVEAEDIQATEEQINEQIDLMAIQYQMEADKVREMLGEQNMRYLESDVKMRNAIQFLYDNAVITEPAEEAEEKSEEATE
ncbi:MAG: trigger factor [Anaerovoracaceae bacterium]|nr:trigger factor [Anaerovoracaceae bacterium]